LRQDINDDGPSMFIILTTAYGMNSPDTPREMVIPNYKTML